MRFTVLAAARSLTALTLVLTAFVALPAAAQSPPPSAPALLQAGDSLRIAVWRRADLSGEFGIATDGVIVHPLYREIKVAGLAPQQVEEQVRALLVKYGVETQFVVEPLLRVAVGGEVRAPRLFVVPVGTTVAQAVALAGGVTDRSALGRAELRRADQKWKVDLEQPGSDAAAFEVRSGDVVMVPRRRAILELVGPLASMAAAVAATYSILR